MGPDGGGRMGGLHRETFPLAFVAPGRIPAGVEVPPGVDGIEGFGWNPLAGGGRRPHRRHCEQPGAPGREHPPGHGSRRGPGAHAPAPGHGLHGARPPHPPRTLAGRVTDEEGRPLAGAPVGLSWEDDASGYRQVTAGPDGAFTVATVAGETFRLDVRLDGYVPLVEPEYRLPPPGEAAIVRLRRGHEVLVEVVDAAGAPVAVDRVWAELGPDVSLDGERVAANVFRLRGLPAGEVVLMVRAGDHTWRRRHVGSTPRALVVASAGALTAPRRPPRR